MSIRNFFTHAVCIFAINVSPLVLPTANAETYAPYPGILAAKLVAVNSAANIVLSAETWPGFRRTFSISLAGIEAPQDKPGIEPCQRELAEQALEFVKKYLSDAARIEIHDMTMHTSAEQNVRADIHTEQGSLSEALLRQGLARPKVKGNNEPWC